MPRRSILLFAAACAVIAVALIAVTVVLASRPAPGLQPGEVVTTGEARIGGPFQLVEWQEGQFWRMEANPDYFGEGPYIERLIFKYIPDMTVLYTQFRSGDIDVVGQASDGDEALALIEQLRPDVVLTDIEMPRMDGYELAKHMKADPRLRDVLIMMITSRTGEKHRQRAFDLGVDRYLGKPYQEPELMRNVNELLKVPHGRD